MCGIGGFFGREGGSGEVARAMLAALAARGPDASHAAAFATDLKPLGDGSEGPHALLHARLAIIDPRPEADQPMASDDGQVWLCYNGEVYGWGEDARELAAERPFRTRSDTEFILRGYEEWGIEGLLPRLRGMFAFALLDRRRGKLFLVRDRVGKKPLLWWAEGRQLAFASTLRGLLPALPATARRLSPGGLDAYLAHRYIPAPLSLVEGVRRLPNGHLLEWSLDGSPPVVRRWWSPADEPNGDGDWQATLDEAIRLRCVADRPVGLFLSGGIDSTVLACRLAALGQPLETFTAAFPGSPLDEAPAAAALSRRLGLPHRTVDVPVSIRDDFPAIVAALDEPFADPSAIPLWYLARETTRHVKVVLGGDGGDELLAGYKRYRAHLRSRFRRGLRLPRGRVSPALLPFGVAKLREELAMSWEEAYSLRFSGLSPMQRAFLQPGRTLPVTWWRMPAREPSALAELLAIDMDNYLPEYILRKGDLMTMGHGLELRAPLLDQRFVAAIRALPPEVRFTEPRKLLLAGVLPDAVAVDCFSGKKKGFNPPLAHWLESDLGERHAGLGARLAAASDGQLDGAAVDALLAAYCGGQAKLAENVLQLLLLDESLAQLRTLGLQ
ncbi:MAG: asparagine synthase (glutamine-hydrolyzing) [Betaproteobacteria bacterium]|nr:asparagine synthase (glutamine-hydrolyzing) [Betaproteobacteria bacterium]